MMIANHGIKHGLTNKILLLLYNLLILSTAPRVLKRTITILILLLLFFSQVGYHFVYMIQQHMIKEAAEEQILSTINKNQLKQINETENRNAIIWEEEGKEFSLNNQMYDVAKKEIVNGKALLLPYQIVIYTFKIQFYETRLQKFFIFFDDHCSLCYGINQLSA